MKARRIQVFRRVDGRNAGDGIRGVCMFATEDHDPPLEGSDLDGRIRALVGGEPLGVEVPEPNVACYHRGDTMVAAEEEPHSIAHMDGLLIDGYRYRMMPSVAEVTWRKSAG